MSSRFVSGGAIDAATGDAVDLAQVKKQQAALATTSTATSSDPKVAPTSAAPSARQAEWAAVEKELEADRQRRAEARKALASGAGQEKSLYEVLQANKAAKQAAFEEEHRLKHQFRALDEDEIAFLDGIEADARAAAARVAAETAAGLDAFRAAQTNKSMGADGKAEAAEAAEEDGDDNGDTIEKLVDDGGWAVTGRKRKRRADKMDKAGAFPNLRRKGSSIEKEEEVKETVGSSASGTTKEAPKAAAAAQPPPSATASKPKPALGLVAYGSDDDDDDEGDSD